METIKTQWLLICFAILLLCSSCTQDPIAVDTPITNVPPNGTIPPKTAPPTTQPNTYSLPTAHAGQDFQVLLPKDYCWLSGGYSANGYSEIQKTFWRKTSGPSSYALQYPDSLRTKVSNLEKGIYEFELTITNKSGLSDKDTVRVIVGQMSEIPKEMVFKDLKWIFPWYSTIEIKDFKRTLPNTVFKVYIQRENKMQWEEVPFIDESTNSIYEYFVESRANGGGFYNYGSLYIFYYGNETQDSPSVKIIY